MTQQIYTVTGGAGFIGAALVRRLVHAGHCVRVLDNQSRGTWQRLAGVVSDIECIEGDIRDAATVDRAIAGSDVVCHLAYINGTEHFYAHPDRVLDVGVKGMVHVLDACLAHAVQNVMLVSSSEVYQEPPVIPAPEQVPLVIPDPLNPRYSYGAGKIISEMMVLHARWPEDARVTIVRPHNIYGPDMGQEHVIPQLIQRMHGLQQPSRDVIDVPIQGTGQETRAFCCIDDCIEGILCVLERGAHRGIYHVGTKDEVSIAFVVEQIGAQLGCAVTIRPGAPAQGSVARRCPDIRALSALGYAPCVTLTEGLQRTIPWYVEHAAPAPTAGSTAG